MEPEDEFYLRLRSDAPEVVYVDLAVDGTAIQKGQRAHPGRTSRVGVIRADSIAGKQRTTEVALRIAVREGKSPRWIERGCDCLCILDWSGRGHVLRQSELSYPAGGFPSRVNPVLIVPHPVVVASTVKYDVPENTYYLNPSLASSDVGYVPGKSNEEQKKGGKSAEGTTALRTHQFSQPSTSSKKPKKQEDDEQSTTSESEDEPKEKDPKKLGTITLKYCSTIGLIHAGILAKPPNWDEERLRKTCSKRTREDHARILSEIKIRKFELLSERINGQGEKVVERTEVEMLDLTESDI